MATNISERRDYMDIKEMVRFYGLTSHNLATTDLIEITSMKELARNYTVQKSMYTYLEKRYIKLKQIDDIVKQLDDDNKNFFKDWAELYRNAAGSKVNSTKGLGTTQYIFSRKKKGLEKQINEIVVATAIYKPF